MNMDSEEAETCKTSAGWDVVEEKLFMVKSELEAAEALAGLAHSGQGNHHPRPQVLLLQQVPLHESPDVCTSHPQNLPQAQPHAQQEPAIVLQVGEPSEKVSNVIINTVKDEKNDEIKAAGGGGSCTSTSYFSVGSCSSKSRQPLTEVEKEARRLRRVLANRESARQTIRRRQAMFEELTRKAADLALENEDLKKKKELAVNEHDSLKMTNDCLKEQITEMMKAESEEMARDSNANHVEHYVSASSITPFSPYNPSPMIPFHWSAMVQPLDATLFQSRSLRGIANPSFFAMPHSSRPEICPEQRESMMVANPGALLYVLPFPCFFPMHSPTSALRPQYSPLQNGGQHQNFISNQWAASSPLENSMDEEDDQPCLSLEVKREGSNSTASIAGCDVRQAGFGYPPDGDTGNIGGIYPERMILMPTPVSCVRSPSNFVVGKNDNMEPVASSNGQRENDAPVEYHEPMVHRSKLLADATTATEARRRRKELMKLKMPQ